MRISFLFLFAFISFQLYAQSYFTGKIIYQTYTYLNTDLVTPLDSGIVTEYFSDSALRIDQDTPMGMQTAIYNFKDSNNVILMELMGQKLALTFSVDTSIKPIKGIKHKCKSQRIDGYKIKKALVPVTEDSSAVVWYIKNTPAHINMKYPGLKGYPVIYAYKDTEATQTYRAIEIKAIPFGPDVFTIPQGYKKMTLKEFYESFDKK